jgi:hypothetical protein
MTLEAKRLRKELWLALSDLIIYQFLGDSSFDFLTPLTLTYFLSLYTYHDFCLHSADAALT